LKRVMKELPAEGFEEKSWSMANWRERMGAKE
jgi:hypothetical protein